MISKSRAKINWQKLFCTSKFWGNILPTPAFNCHKKPTFFEHLRNVNIALHNTFKAECIILGLLEEDKEWIQHLKEAAIMQTGYQLQRLLLYSYPLLSNRSNGIVDKVFDEYIMT
ncbi:hypothetical protein GIB67_001678 [Kingdonia uniflora]|uniref:Uncharacterized protein n=1 Tax=Kingdonia uniflora TaxID=39325 RepID=A0A7J7LN18_9MAGN|nr:hypothetical protein GIB67_001678 [Kingdonia uniflora]